MSFDSESDRQADAAGYERSRQTSQREARAFQIAQIILEGIDTHRMNTVTIPINDALSAAGLMRPGETIDDLHREAIDVVKQHAESRQRIADETAVIRDDNLS